MTDHGEIWGLGLGGGGKSVKLFFPRFQLVWQTQRLHAQVSSSLRFRVWRPHTGGAVNPAGNLFTDQGSPANYSPKSIWPPRQRVSKTYSSSTWSTVIIIKSEILYTCDVWRVFFLIKYFTEMQLSNVVNKWLFCWKIIGKYWSQTGSATVLWLQVWYLEMSHRDLGVQ